MHKVIFILLSLFILSCQKSIDFEAEKRNIQSQIDLVGQAHFSKDANQFYQPNAESWYDVRGGTITHVNKSDMISGTQSYLDNMEFQEMIRRDDPIIEISDDATLASYIGSVTVKGILKESPVFWVVSWQNVLKKIDGEWKIISSANTEANEETSAMVLLNHVRNNLGTLKDNPSIYAYAECQGPERPFKTLILSRETDGKMEQVSGDSHILMKHGRDSTWAYNLNKKSPIENIDQSTKMFIQGHELHWLSFRPEDRYAKPILKEITKFQNQTAFNIEFKDALNKPVNFYYSFDTYFPLGFDLLTNDQGDLVTVHFENWEKINEVSVFKKAIFKHRGEIFEYNFVDIKFNSLDDQDFESKIGLIK